MKRGIVNRERVVVAHHQTAEVAEPSVGAFRGPPSPKATQDPTVAGGRLPSVLTIQGAERDVALVQLPVQHIVFVAAIDDYPVGSCPGTPGLMPPPYADRLQRRRDEFDLRGGRRVKVVAQRAGSSPIAPQYTPDQIAPFALLLARVDATIRP